MPQKPLDASDATKRLTIRLTTSTCDKLDKIRGDLTRSEWVRAIIVQEIEGQHDWIESLPTVEAEVTLGKPARKIKVVPAKKHYHRFEKGGEAGRKMVGRMNVPLFLYSCECGETEVR